MKTAKKNTKAKASKKSEDKPAETTALSLADRRSAALATMTRKSDSASKPDDMDLSQANRPYLHFFHSAKENATTDAIRAALGDGENLKLGQSFLVAGGEALRLDNRTHVYILPLAARMFWADATRNAEEFTLNKTSAEEQDGMKAYGHAAGIIAVKNGDDWVTAPFHVEVARGRIDGVESMRKAIDNSDSIDGRVILGFKSPKIKAGGNEWTGFKAPQVVPNDEARAAHAAAVASAEQLSEDVIEVMERFNEYDAEIDGLMD